MVFDWDGLPVKRYDLDKNIDALGIDEEGGFAYVQYSEENASVIGRFPLVIFY